jgi:hypothetical protein
MSSKITFCLKCISERYVTVFQKAGFLWVRREGILPPCFNLENMGYEMPVLIPLETKGLVTAATDVDSYFSV